MNSKYQNDLTSVKTFMWFVAAVGFILFIRTAWQTDFRSFDGKFVVIALFTIILSSRIVVDIQALKSNISVSDVFIFLTALLFGFEAAILLAAVEAYATSFRFTKQMRFRAFNAGAVAVSLFAASSVSASLFDRPHDISFKNLSYDVIGSLGTFVLVHYFINTSLMAIANSLRTAKPVWQIWKESYLWMSITCLASGSIGLLFAIAVQSITIYAILLGLPILGIIYFSYRSYHGKLEITLEQAEQAQRHLLEMQASAERFRGAFGQAPIGMGLVSKEGNWLQVNQSLCKILGYAESEMLETNFQAFVHQADLVEFLSKIGLVLQNKLEAFQIEARFFDKNGEEIWTSVNISLINIDIEQTSQLIFQIQDITARRAAAEKLRYAAFYDSLTNLANRTFLLEKLSDAIERAKQQKDYGFAVIFMDLDRFNVVNDSMGHIAGDELLKIVAQKLQNCLAPNHTIARLSGDEFTILLDNVKTHAEVEVLVENLRQHISSNYNLRGHNFFINVSLGVAIYNENYGSSDDLLRDADTALHKAKAQGRARYLIFDNAMHAQVIKQLEIESDLKTAVEENQFFLVYQPILSLETDRLVGFEALVRWNHPEKGLINPNDFISLAEETGDIIGIGTFVIEEACRQVKKWQDEFDFEFPLTMSVNVSAKQFTRSVLFETVMNSLETSRINPSQLKLEVTESAIVDNIENAALILKQLRLLGVKISMDDFGTGYSSLSYLHRLPITTLKIDRSFITNMETKRESAEIVHTIVLLAKNLGLDVVAEGIETKSQLDKLKEFDCDYGQGYIFSKPLEAKDAVKFVRELYRQILEQEIDSKTLRSMPRPSQSQNHINNSNLMHISDIDDFSALIEIDSSRIS